MQEAIYSQLLANQWVMSHQKSHLSDYPWSSKLDFWKSVCGWGVGEYMCAVQFVCEFKSVHSIARVWMSVLIFCLRQGLFAITQAWAPGLQASRNFVCASYPTKGALGLQTVFIRVLGIGTHFWSRYFTHWAISQPCIAFMQGLAGLPSLALNS